MEIKLLATVFLTVFIAELGDKTQLATLLFAAREDTSLATVFVAASAALILSSAIGVAAGAAVASFVEPKLLGWIAGAAFILVGIGTIVQA